MGANPTVAAIAWCSVSVMANEKHDKNRQITLPWIIDMEEEL